MKNKSLILVIVLFALVLGAAVILYPTLSEKALTEATTEESTEATSDSITPDISASEEKTTLIYTETVTKELTSTDTEPDTEEEASAEEITSEEITTSAVQYKKAESFNFFDKNGNAVSLEDFSGKPVILNFWATWCGYCIKEMPDFQKAYEEYGDEIQFLIINTDNSIKEGEKFIENKGYTFPTYYDLDREATITYSITGIPRTIAIDKDGNIIYNRAGMINEAQLLSIIESIR